MEFQDNFRFCSSSEVHVPGVFYYMTYNYRSVDRLYIFDFYKLDSRIFMSITCNGKHKYFEVYSFYYNSLSLLSMDNFVIDCVSYLW